MTLALLHGGARKVTPLDIGYNIAVRSIARRLFPTGYDTTDNEGDAPTSLSELNTVIQGGAGRMVVWSGACENTIFDCPETNQDFRAWHDWCHWRGQFPFTLDGEKDAVAMQCDNLQTLYGYHADVSKWQLIVRADIIGTFAHREIAGAYPVNQRAWTEHILNGLEQVA